MRRIFLVAAIFVLAFFPLLRRAQGVTEEEKKKAFLRAREEMQTVPAEESATPKPKPKPKAKKSSPTARTKPSPTTTPVETPRPKHQPGSGPTAEPTGKKTREPLPSPPAEPPGSRVSGEEHEMPARTPGPTPTPKPTPAPTPSPRLPPAATSPPAPVTIEKSGLDEASGLEPTPEPAPKRHWWQFGRGDNTPYQYLSRTLRDAIDRAPVARHRWRYIVVHNSGTKQGNAKIFDYYHRHTRKMPNGLAYHFVIGNGSSSGNGQIEIGDRWRRQINGGHVHSDYLNNIALGICLVGDFNRSVPTKAQLDATEELIRYLRKRVGQIDRKDAIVKAHREINPPQWPTDCPGDRFPYNWLHGHFN